MIPLGMLPDRPYAVLGLGRSGRAAARALLASRRTVLCWDDSQTVRDAAASEGLPIVDLNTCELDDMAALVLSPGIPHTFPEPHPIVARVRAAGIDVIGDIELLFRAQPQATYVGITGTNGKSTTTALVSHILAAAGAEIRFGGNLGPPVLDFEPAGSKSIYVLELSSYQLELTPNVALNVAMLLNISPDHLGRHGGMDGYIAAKRRIFAGAPSGATAVVGVDDPHCRNVRASLGQQRRHRILVVSGQRRVCGGVYAQGGLLWDSIDGAPKPVLRLSEARALPGEHNGQNAAAAYAAVRSLGVDGDLAAKAILDFPGLAHRQERIAEVAGITYVNDSKATNGDAAARALSSYDNIYWIAGGRPKEDGLAAVDPWLGRIRHAFLIGEAEETFARVLEGKIALSRCGTLDRAFAAARSMAAADQLDRPVVLLSPACASFDQFPNFEARGEAFRTMVEAISA
jgi:UDP-N-acetylmuramoylalanine--D-glutamate ligase